MVDIFRKKALRFSWFWLACKDLSAGIVHDFTWNRAFQNPYWYNERIICNRNSKLSVDFLLQRAVSMAAPWMEMDFKRLTYRCLMLLMMIGIFGLCCISNNNIWNRRPILRCCFCGASYLDLSSFPLPSLSLPLPLIHCNLSHSMSLLGINFKCIFWQRFKRHSTFDWATCGKDTSSLFWRV